MKNVLSNRPKTGVVWTGSRKCLGSEFHVARPATEKDRRRYELDRTVLPADDWQQNEDVALRQSQRLEHSEQPDTEERYRSDSDASSYAKGLIGPTMQSIAFRLRGPALRLPVAKTLTTGSRNEYDGGQTSMSPITITGTTERDQYYRLSNTEYCSTTG